MYIIGSENKEKMKAEKTKSQKSGGGQVVQAPEGIYVYSPAPIHTIFQLYKFE